MSDYLNDTAARLIINARGFTPDAGLDRVAALFDTDRAAFNALPQSVKSQVSTYVDLRSYHRAALEAGVIPDPDTTRNTTREGDHR